MCWPGHICLIFPGVFFSVSQGVQNLQIEQEREGMEKLWTMDE